MSEGTDTAPDVGSSQAENGVGSNNTVVNSAPVSDGPLDAVSSIATAERTSLKTENSSDVSFDSIPQHVQGRGYGAGRGRGRGAKSRASLTGPYTPTTNGHAAVSDSPQLSGRGRGRGSSRGRVRGSKPGRGGKRKRNEDVIKAEDSPSDTDDSDLQITQVSATRSGRSVQKPATFAPSELPSASPIVGVKRKRFVNKNPENTVCSVCLRPHSPATNMIVFCDGCNTPFHRYCHHPPIEQVVVDVPDREWYCSECTTIHVSGYDVSTFSSGAGLSEDKIRAHLSKLPSAILVDLLLQASHQHPDVQVIPPDPQQRAAHRAEKIVAAAEPDSATAAMPPPPIPLKTNTATNGNSSLSTTASQHHQQRPPDEELEPLYEDDPPVRGYPKPGFGLARLLPPEKDDESILLDDNSEVYTHIWQSDAKAANEGIYGPVTVSPGDDSAKANGVRTMKAQ